MDKQNLDVSTLENWLWEAACKIRGEVDAAKYKDWILPLIFIKRLSDVFEDEYKKLIGEYDNKEAAQQILDSDKSVVRFYIPEKARWENIKNTGTGLGEYLTDVVRVIAKENIELQGVIDTVDFNATTSGQRIISDEKLKTLVSILSRYRLGLKDVEPDIFGRAYEFLLRKFAEGSGQSAGEFYTPKGVALLMAKILNPKPGDEVYDPCCGSGGLLIKSALVFQENFGKVSKAEPPRFYGQELLPETFAMAKMNVFIHDMEATIALGNTMINPKFTNSKGGLKTFDLVTANPMWSQNFELEIFENDPYSRFIFGIPYETNADWGWIQHMYVSLKDKGKIAVVLDTGSVTRGSGDTKKNREKEIRKKFVRNGLLDGVILLPKNMFYNNQAPGVILIIGKEKINSNCLLINASQSYKKGDPKNYFSPDTIRDLYEIYEEREEKTGISYLASYEEIKQKDFNLNPLRYIATEKQPDDALDFQNSYIGYKESLDELQEIDPLFHNLLSTLNELSN